MSSDAITSILLHLLQVEKAILEIFAGKAVMNIRCHVEREIPIRQRCGVERNQTLSAFWKVGRSQAKMKMNSRLDGTAVMAEL